MNDKLITKAGKNKIHTKISDNEQDNVGTQSAHRVTLAGESAYQEGKKLAHSAYRSVRNSPYRNTAKYDAKSSKTRKKSAQKKSNKQKSFGIYTNQPTAGEVKIRANNDITKTKRAVKSNKANPVMILIIPAFMIIFGFMAMNSVCMDMETMTAVILEAVCYVAEDEDIEQVDLAYTEWETDLLLEISNTETIHAGYDEYRYNVDSIGHDPHELMAFLTAVYSDFKYDDIEWVLRDLFAKQYNLEYVPEIEIRISTDDDGNEAEYEWHVLNVNLTSVSLMEVILPLMFSDQTEHFYILMETKGGRQYAGNPFIIDWIPYVTSNYGYRIHPVTGVKDYHKGIDIARSVRTSIYAGISGTVTAADYDGEYGNYIVINNGKGLEMKYAHCDTLMFSVGQTVTKGDIIATVGNTGTSSEPHLHMEILKNGIHINPIYFVEWR